MASLEDEYPALAADAAKNPESARLLALLAKTDEALKSSPKTQKIEIQTES